MNQTTLFLFRAFGFFFCSLLLIGCGANERQAQSRGFHLPEGDIEMGRSLFVKFDCNYCHSVAGVEFPKSQRPDQPPAIMIGGEINRVHSYGELVTSIISPDHVISPQYLTLLTKEEKAGGGMTSPMPGYNEEINVGQLVDLVAFLHSRYTLIEPDLENFYYTTP